MIDVTQENLPSFRQTNRLICTEALRQNLKVTVPVLGSSLITIYRNDNSRVHIYSSTPPGTSYEASLQSDNKYATYLAFIEAGLPVLPTIRVRKDTEDDAIDVALGWDTGAVAKPLDASHGDGITTNITDLATIKTALSKAYAASASGKTALLQQMYIGAIDLRLLCIDYTFVAAVRRIPARVFGDGTATIKELITQANSATDRGERYVERLAYISVNEALEYITATDDISRVPATGEEVMVLGKANYGSGGETENIIDQLPSWLIEMAQKVARTSRLPLCGVDILVNAVPQPHSTEAALHPIVNEINKCPSLYIHEHPTNNAGSAVANTYISYLLSL
jgi:cyanophycin synthetase